MATSVKAFKANDGKLFTGESSEVEADNHNAKLKIVDEFQNNIDIYNVKDMDYTDLSTNTLERLVTIGIAASGILKNK